MRVYENCRKDLGREDAQAAEDQGRRGQAVRRPLARRRTGTSEAEPNAQRLMKEVGMYRKEVEQNQIRLEKLRADGAEEWDVKNAVRLSPSFLPFA